MRCEILSAAAFLVRLMSAKARHTISVALKVKSSQIHHQSTASRDYLAYFIIIYTKWSPHAQQLLCTSKYVNSSTENMSYFTWCNPSSIISGLCIIYSLFTRESTYGIIHIARQGCPIILFQKPNSISDTKPRATALIFLCCAGFSLFLCTYYC